MKIIINVISILAVFSLLQGCVLVKELKHPKPPEKKFDQVASARPASDIAKALSPITKEEERGFCNGIRQDFGGITGAVNVPGQARSNLFLRLSKYSDPRIKEFTVYSSNDWGVRGDRSLEGKDLLLVDVDKQWLPNLIGNHCDSAIFYSVSEIKALPGDGYGIRLAGGNVYAIKGKSLDAFIGKPLVIAYRTHRSDEGVRQMTPAEIEAKKNDPKTGFCDDINSEFGKLYNSNDPRIIKVKAISPIAGKQGISLGIIQSATVRAPKVPALNSLFRCPAAETFWIIEKVEKSGATYALTMRDGKSFKIEPKGKGTDLSGLVGVPQSTVLISYTDAD